MRSLTYSRHDEGGADGDDPHGCRVDAWKLEQEMQHGRVVGAVAVALRHEATPLAREARHLPEFPPPGHGSEVPSAAWWQASPSSSGLLWPGLLRFCTSGTGECLPRRGSSGERRLREQLGASEQRLRELSRGLVHQFAVEARCSGRCLDESLCPLDVARRGGEDAVHRLDLARVDHPLAVVTLLERAPRGQDKAEVVAEPRVRPVEHLQARTTGCRHHACEGVVGGAGADRQHRHAERGSEIARPEDERLEPVARGGDPLGLDEPASRLDLRLETDPVRERLGCGEHVLGGLDLREYDHVGTRLRRRPQVVLPPRRRASVDAERRRAAERASAQCGDREPARLLLVLRCDRVLEVDDHLVGAERWSLREHALARRRNGEAGAARAEWHVATLTRPRPVAATDTKGCRLRYDPVNSHGAERRRASPFREGACHRPLTLSPGGGTATLALALLDERDLHSSHLLTKNA